MNRKAACLLALILILLKLTAVSAQCNSTQVNINSASAEELGRLYGIGPSKSQGIIKSRPFKSVDSLIRVSGIGNATMAKIKDQGLACVNEKNKTQDPASDATPAVSSSENSDNATAAETGAAQAPQYNQGSPLSHITIPQPVTLQTIDLNPSDSQDSSNANNPDSSAGHNNIAIYGLIAFSLLLVTLFAAKKFRTKRYKSEFD